MKKILHILLLCCITPLAHAFQIIHPLDYTATEREKSALIDHIKTRVSATHGHLWADAPYALKMIEKAELQSFVKLTTATNRELLDRIITKYCGIGICNYSTILLMYNEQSRTPGSNLEQQPAS